MKFKDARKHGWISVFLKEDNGLDGIAINAIRTYIIKEWHETPENERSIRKFAKRIGEPYDRIRRFIHNIPGLSDALGFSLNSKSRLTL